MEHANPLSDQSRQHLPDPHHEDEACTMIAQTVLSRVELHSLPRLSALPIVSESIRGNSANAHRLVAFCTSILLSVFACGLTCTQAANPSNTLSVPSADLPLHVALPLSNVERNDTSVSHQLREIGCDSVTLPTQITAAVAEDGTADRDKLIILAHIPARTSESASREFALLTEEHAPLPTGGFCFEDVTDTSLKLSQGEQSVLVYNHGMITCDQVPETDHRRSRACYIHPLWGLNGEVLTDDFPKDHYHHHGAFWTWPHVRVGDQEYDLWAGAKIRAKFIRWLGRETGPVAGILGVENGWFVDDKQVMIERVWIRAFAASEGTRAIDLCLTWIPTDQPVALWGAGGKSYGGLTVRFAPPSRRAAETVITVPQGRTTRDLPDTPLQWADFTTQYPDVATVSGAAIFVAPDHPDYPPTWLTRHYGPLCIGWPGVKPRTFAPGQPFQLKYRLWIHKQSVEVNDLAKAYSAYCRAYSPVSQESHNQ